MVKNDSPATFKVVFFGVVHDSARKPVVMARFKALFGIKKASTLEHLFSGNMVVLKRGISYEDASKYQQAIAQAGSECSIEPDTALGQFSGTDINYERKKKRVVSSMAPKDLSEVGLEPIK